MDHISNANKKSRTIRKVDENRFKSMVSIQNNKEYWKKVFDELDSYHKSEIDQSRALSDVLPPDLYKKVCRTLDISPVNHIEEQHETIEVTLPRRAVKEPQISNRKCLYINRELDSDTDVEVDASDGEDEPNIHQELLKKPVREQITWATRYLQPEKEEEKSLVKKADDLTDRIATQFCEYMKQLGGDQQSQLFTAKAIKELFQVEFDTHVARSLRVVPKELPCIEEKVANFTGNPQYSCSATLERAITSDIKAEQELDRVVAFNKGLPRADQHHAPRNNTKRLWRSARHVPKDLVTLKTVWEGITNLRSVKEYCRWMIEHPEHRRPPYLNNLGFFNPEVLKTKPDNKPYYEQWPQFAEHLPDDLVPIEHIHTKLSLLTDDIM